MKSEEDEAFDDLAKRQGSWGGGFTAKRKMAADKFIAAEERKVGERYGYVPKLHPSEWIGEPAQEPPSEWAGIKAILDEYGLQAIDFVADFKAALAQPAQRQPLTNVIKAAEQVLEFTEIAHRPPVRDSLEVGHMVRVRLHALADLHDAIAAHNIDEQRALDAIMREAQPAQPQQDESDLLTIAYQSGFYDGKKATLAQPAQEPVAWMNLYGGVLLRLFTGLEKNSYTIPLYTTPPQREWVGLANEDWNSTPYDTEFRAGAEWAEAKLKEKNNG